MPAQHRAIDRLSTCPVSCLVSKLKTKKSRKRLWIWISLAAFEILNYCSLLSPPSLPPHTSPMQPLASATWGGLKRLISVRASTPRSVHPSPRATILRFFNAYLRAAREYSSDPLRAVGPQQPPRKPAHQGGQHGAVSDQECASLPRADLRQASAGRQQIH